MINRRNLRNRKDGPELTMENQRPRKKNPLCDILCVS